ncbi:MAG: hypothetical protein JRF33_14275 [Deltaproteobacteria bacterium]|nr:hypothetical protein [Deltaproteobacteria bacterium]
MFRRISLAAALLGTLLNVPTTSADPVEPYLGTKGYTSLNTDSLVSLDLHIPTGEYFSGVVPELVGQFGFGPAAVGLNLGFSYANPDADEADSGFWLGNIDLFAKGKHCLDLPGGIRACFGGQLEISIAPMEADDGEDIGAISVGMLNHLRYNRFGSEFLVATPTLGFQLTHDLFFAQFHIGPEMLIYLNDDVSDARDGYDTFMVYGLAGGANIMNLVSAGLGFRGMSSLTFDDNNSFFALDILAQVHLPIIKPYLMLSIPLDEDTRDILDMSITMGAAAVF